MLALEYPHQQGVCLFYPITLLAYITHTLGPVGSQYSDSIHPKTKIKRALEIKHWKINLTALCLYLENKKHRNGVLYWSAYNVFAHQKWEAQIKTDWIRKQATLLLYKSKLKYG